MESLDSVANLHILEQKITGLIDLLKAERAAYQQVLAEKYSLVQRLEALENSLLKESKSIDELNQERTLTKMVVDELIGTIDKLVHEHNAPSA